jgi:DNA-directed RNA polymerase subunit N (RpoN/RPB10)
MIIPVRCFTCGKVCATMPVSRRRCCRRSAEQQQQQHASLTRAPPRPSLLTQVIGNKWDTYLELLTSGYEEG